MVDNMENLEKNILDYGTVALDIEKHALVIIDQTQLPGRIELLSLTDLKDIWEAIRLLKVRGGSGHRCCGGHRDLSGGRADRYG